VGSTQQGGVVSEPMGIYMPDKMARDCELIYNFKLRPDDVWIVTYPKCGTTWATVSTILFITLQSKIAVKNRSRESVYNRSRKSVYNRISK
jgi:hypothetical protein